MHDVAALYPAFDPIRPLAAGETDLYVDWARALYPKGNDPSSRLVRGLQHGATPQRPVALLLAGQSGVGKTTELSRIRSRLTHGEDGRKVFVSTLQAGTSLDLEAIHPEDLVMQMARQLAADLSGAGMDLSGFGITDLLRSVSEQVLRSRPGETGTPADPFAVGFTRKEIWTGRDEHRARWRSQLPAVFDLVNDELLPAAREHLRRDGFDDVLLVVDELDRIPRKMLADQGRTNHENLFLPRVTSSAGESTSLLGFRSSLLLTVPLELTFGEAATQMQAVYGGPAHRIACAPVRDRAGRPVGRAENALIEILGRRATRAGIDAARLFEDAELLRRVVGLSGGNIRGLLVMMTGLLDRVDHLPISAEIVNGYVKTWAADLVRALMSSHTEILQRIENDAPAPTDDPGFLDLLRYRDILLYEDATGNAWYGVHPVLEKVAS